MLDPRPVVGVRLAALTHAWLQLSVAWREHRRTAQPLNSPTEVVALEDVRSLRSGRGAGRTQRRYVSN